MNVLTDADFVGQPHQLSSVDISCVFRDEVVVKVLHVIINDVLHCVEEAQGIFGTSEPHDPRKCDVGSISLWDGNEIPHLVHQVCQGLVQGYSSTVQALQTGHDTDEGLAPDAEFCGVVPRSHQLFGRFLGLPGFALDVYDWLVLVQEVLSTQGK